MKSRTFARLGAAIAMVAALGVTACDDETPQQPVTPTIAMSPSSQTIEVGGTGVVVVNITGVNSPQVTFTSSNTSVATVSASGTTATITGVSAGSATITATVAGTSLVAAAQVTVTGTGEDIDVTITPSSATVGVGSSITLVANVSGSTQGVTWQSQDESVATVTQSGVVTGVSQGTAVITATSNENTSVSANATITVAADPVTVSIAPSNPTVFVGETLQFSAVVSGSSNTGVTWASSNPSIATIDQNGVASGVAPGSAIITARSDANPNVVASTTLTVTERPEGNVSIRDLGGADPDAIAGTLTITLNVDAPVGSGVRAVQLVLSCPTNGDVVVGRQNVSAGTSGQIEFVVNTARFDETTGEPDFINEDCEFRAELLDASDNVIATGSNVEVTLANADDLFVTVATDRSAIGGDGLQWRGGNVTVTALPVMYSGGSVASVTFDLTPLGGGGSAELTDADGSDGFQVVFSEDDALAADGVDDVEDDDVIIGVSSITTGGEVGPSDAAAAEMRLDNVGPTITADAAFVVTDAEANFTDAGETNFWVNADFEFADLIDLDEVTDGGVDREECRVVVGDDPDFDDATIVDPVAMGDDLSEAAVTTYTAWLICEDALDNESMEVLHGDVAGDVEFGVDLTDPTIAYAPESAQDGDIYTAAPGDDWVVEYADLGNPPSGFETDEPVQSTIVAYDDDADNDACPLFDDADGDSPADCEPVFTDADVDLRGQGADADADGLADPDEAYFTFTAFVEDFAGNNSGDLPVRTVLVDMTAPAVDAADWGDLDGLEAASFDADLSDNLDLAVGQLAVEYNSGGALADVVIGMPEQSLGSFGFDVLSTEENTTGTIDPFLVSIETTAAGAPTGVIYEAYWLLAYAEDVAGWDNGGADAFDISGDVAGAAASYGADPLFVSWEITSADDASTIRAELLVDEDVDGSATNPFDHARLYCAVADNFGFTYRHAALDESPVISDLGTQRRFAYEFSPTADCDGDIFVAGVNEDGEALRTEVQAYDP